MATKLTPLGRFSIVAVIICMIAAVKVFWYDKREVDAKDSIEVSKIVLPDNPEASFTKNAVLLPLPTNKEVNNGGTRINWEIMAWNAQFPLMYANGGTTTTKGSLIDQHGLNINLIRQDDTNKSLADLVAFANAYKENPETPGVIVSYMGDALSITFDYLNKQLEPLGPDYQAIAFYAMGKSLGEDKLMGPVEWKRDPKNAIGKTVACFMRDGDMNILLKWAGDNDNLRVNPDEKTYDPNAINIVAANDFLDAANKYITGYTEQRRVIENGKITNKTIEVGVDAVATWTPGDVNIAQQKGGLVSIVSTKEYSSQMPNISITIKKFAYDHRTDMENIIRALGTAGDQVRSFSTAKEFAAKVSAQVYDQNDYKYWLKYYNGTTEKDIQGLKVELGGSMSFNLNDAANLLGLGEDGIDRYKVVYQTFGDILSKMYPEIMPSYPQYTKIMDKSFLQTVLSNTDGEQGLAMVADYADGISSPVSSKTYQIQFKTNSAVIQANSYKILEDIINAAVIGENLNIQVNGYTDNVGNDEQNLILSQKRANSVKNYLISKGISEERIQSVGYGETDPIQSNLTEEGRYQNRRVKIEFGL